MTKKYQKQVVDRARAIQLLEEIVQERGENYRYRDHYMHCVNFGYPRKMGHHGPYNRDTPPACIAGHVYHKLGLTVEECGIGVVRASVYLIRLATSGAINFTEGAIRALTAAQAEQDSGSTWGEALRVARIASGQARPEDFGK